MAGAQGIRAGDAQPRDVPHGQGRRRILTALSYDLVGSTHYLNTLDIEDYRDLITAFQEESRKAIEAFEGELQSVEGDGGMAIFPIEMDAKDAASLAIQAGYEIVAACARVATRRRQPGLQVRVGIATSMSLVQDGSLASMTPKVAGLALAMATRLQSLAVPGTVLVSDGTRTLARRSHVFALQGSQPVKGFVNAEPIWRAVRHKREVGRYFAFGRIQGPMINRSAEQAMLADLWAQALRGRGQAIVIEGEAGIGKSRLIHQLRTLTRSDRGRRLMFQCSPGGGRSTLSPLVQLLPKSGVAGEQTIAVGAVYRLFREQGILDESVIELFANLVGAEGADGSLRDASLEIVRRRTADAVRRSIDMLATVAPRLIVIEDVHWIDPTSRQIVAELLRAIVRLPVLVVMTSRPIAPGGMRPFPEATVLSLQPLRDSEIQEVVARTLSGTGDAVTGPLGELITRLSGGVPLFAEEICAWAVNNMRQAREALSRNESPSSLSAFETVVAARLASIPGATELAGAAAVAGSQFNAALLGHALPHRSGADISATLDELHRQGLIVEITLAEPPEYTFRHGLIRDTISKALLRAERLALHRRIFETVSHARELAPWIETPALAEHAEKAGMAEEAVIWFTAAGSESANRSALIEARQILEHAIALSDEIADIDMQDRLKLEAIAALGPVVTSSEGPGSPPAQQIYEDGIALARRRPESEKAKLFPIYWGWWFTGENVNGARAHALLEEMRNVDDAEVQLQTRHCVWAIDFYLGKHESCTRCVDEALPLYGQLAGRNNPAQYGGHDTKVCGLAHRGLSLWFTGHPAEAVRSLAEAKAWAEQGGHLGSIAHAYINSGMLALCRRDIEGLRREIAGLRSLTASSRFPTLEATAAIIEGWCEGITGDAEKGRDRIREGLAVHARLQTPEDYPVYCTLLAEVLIRTGEAADALRLLDEAAAGAADSGHFYWLPELHRRRAQLLALLRAPRGDVCRAFAQSLETGLQHGAVTSVARTYACLCDYDPSCDEVSLYRQRAMEAVAAIDHSIPLYVLPEMIVVPGPA